MALSMSVDISKAAVNAPADVIRRAQALQGKRLNTQVARGVQQLFVSHFFTLDTERPNALGGKRTHFYGDAAKATASGADDEGVTITVAQQGIRQRLQGGTIRPVNGKYLTIPLRAEAYGRRAREFANLKFVPLSNGRGLLVADEGKERSGSKRKFIGPKEGGLAYYLLVPSVVQRGDASVIPSEGAIRATIAGVVEMAWNRETRRPA